MPQEKVRVLIVDDSPMVRAMLRSALSSHPRIEVVGFAVDGIDALAKIKAQRPDVITLDVEMPRLNGIGVLERVVGRVPVSFVMVSTLTEAGGQVTLEALRRGAFDYVTKPTGGRAAAMPVFRSELRRKVLAAAKVKGRARNIATGPASSAPKLPPCNERGWTIGIGISCGGPQTLMEMLPAFPSDFPPMLITQHMPAEFTPSFAARLDSICAMKVSEAKGRTRVRQGHILVAPGSHHLKVRRHGMHVFAELDDGPKVTGHKPSADVMFSTLAQACGPRSIGVIMTGMGRDGAQGMSELHRAGAWTLAQDEATSLVYGMPKAAVNAGCVDHSVPLGKIPIALIKLMKRGARTLAAAP